MQEKKRDYSHMGAKEAFVQLPEEDQLTLRDIIHHGIANKMNRVMNGLKTIEIAGKKILAMPLESMTLTLDQQEKFKTEAKGFEIDCSIMSKEDQVQFAKNNPEAPIDWQVSFETLQTEIDGTPYKSFDLFKKVYEGFPDICSMTEDEAIKAELYPIIHYRNFAACKWMAEMNGGHLATLDEDYSDELSDICKVAPGKTNLEKLAAMGQAPLGWRNPVNAKVYTLGSWARLGSGSLDVVGGVRALDVYCDDVDTGSGGYCQGSAISSVVVVDNVSK